MSKKIKNVALLVAGGTSQRMGSAVPKPYIDMGGETLLRRSIKAFLGHPDIDGVRVVIRREHHAMYKKSAENLNMFACVVGGETRQASVRKGLESLIYANPEKVLVHDVARPMVSKALITNVLKAIKPGCAVVPCLPVTDTVRRMEDGAAPITVPRDNLYTIQTPQGFMYDELKVLHEQYENTPVTDDAALFEKDGKGIIRVQGEANNIKVTQDEDIIQMQTAMGLLYETRTGMGYDVHALKPHRPDTQASRQTITLCGVKIPHTHYLEGFSDADVGLHAAVDAILGGISAGDIGQHFPQDDPTWQGADSSRFLMHAYQLLKHRGGELTHLDITLLCEKPKISHYRIQMRNHIAGLLKVSEDRVSIKATTTEKLGFTGRSEGIAAQAVATVKLPRA